MGNDVGDDGVPEFTRGELSLAVALLVAGKAGRPDPDTPEPVQHVSGGRRVQQRLEDGTADPHR